VIHVHEGGGLAISFEKLCIRPAAVYRMAV
jgi:hypothetical protein